MYQWRILSARDRLSPPGFILPCQPVLSREVPTGPEWVHELKWDGYRIVARRSGGVTRLWSRNGRNWTGAFPWIVEAVERLPAHSIVLDGEAVCLRADGLPDFHALQSRQGCQDARLIALAVKAPRAISLRQVKSWLALMP